MPRMKRYCRILIFGILFSYIVTNLLLADTKSMDRILAVGQVNELRQSTLTASNSTWIYDEANKIYTIAGDEAVKSYGKWQEAVDWKCLYIKLDKLSKEPIDWVIKEYDENNRFVGQQIITVKNGENWISLDTGVPFSRFSIKILGADGLQFQIKKMVLLEEIPQKRKGVILFCVILLLSFAMGVFLQKKFAGKKILGNALGKVDDFLTFCYVLAGSSSAFSLGQKWSKKKKKLIRTALFFFLFVYMLIVYNYNVYMGSEYYRYHSLIAVFIILMIAFISVEGTLMPVKNNSKTAYWWYLFWLIACVSDFVVSKRFKFTGWTMLLAVGFFFQIWRQMEEPDEILRDFLHAAELLAAAGVLYNMIFRLKYDGLLYNGYMKSASDFGVLSAFLCLVFLIEIYECYRSRNFGKEQAFYACGASVSVLQVLLSGKEIAVIFTVLLLCITAWKMAKNLKNLSYTEKKNILKYSLLAGGAAIIYYLAVKNIPWYLGTMVQYEKEQFETVKEPYVIGILAQSGIGAYQNVKFHSWNERILIAKAYFREMNLFGHTAADLSIWNKRLNAQNHILQIMYRYGIFAVIPYIMMFFCAIKQAAAVCRKKRENLQSMDVLGMGVLVFWCVIGFFGNLEYPYYQPVWLLYYLVLGRYLLLFTQQSDTCCLAA